MAFRIRLPDGFTVEVDSTEELQAAISVLRPSTAVNSTPDPLPLETDTLLRFLKTLKGGPLKLLQQLAKVDGPLRDDELRSILSFDSNYQLAGTMAGVAKRAKGQGLTLDQIVKRERIEKESGRYYLYQLTEAMRKAMPQ